MCINVYEIWNNVLMCINEIIILMCMCNVYYNVCVIILLY